jgi:diadenosine tetraphosphate (Ap4A) HIT family hydrolase
MPLTPEQVQELKDQLKEQIQHLPEEQKAQAEKQIEEMSPEALESMLKQQQARQSQPQKGVFRMIVDGDIPSKRIDENKDALAVVSVRAISKGHSLVIPKKPAGDANSIPGKALTLAKKVAKKMSAKLKASSTEIQTQALFGETVINVIPVYDKPLNVNSPSYEAKEEELEEVYNLLKVVKKKKIPKIKIKKEIQREVLKLKRRIP